MKFEIGTKVKLKESCAKWHLDHPEIYWSARGVDECFDREVVMHMLVCLGVPMVGKITGYGDDCYRADFKIGNLRTWYYVTSNHVEAYNG